MSKQIPMNDSEFDLFVSHCVILTHFSSLSEHSVARSTSGRRGCFRSRDYGEMNIQSKSEGRISFPNGKMLGVKDQLPIGNEMVFFLISRIIFARRFNL